MKKPVMLRAERRMCVAGARIVSAKALGQERHQQFKKQEEDYCGWSIECRGKWEVDKFGNQAETRSLWPEKTVSFYSK